MRQVDGLENEEGEGQMIIEINLGNKKRVVTSSVDDTKTEQKKIFFVIVRRPLALLIIIGCTDLETMDACHEKKDGFTATTA